MTQELETSQDKETKENNNKLFVKGGAGGPGRPKLTEEEKLMKREVKAYIKEHLEGLAESLPEIRPTLIQQAVQGNINAIKEIHDRVLGKPVQPTVGKVEHTVTAFQKYGES